MIDLKYTRYELICIYVCTKEALLSSQIEGIQATLENIFDPEIEKNINLDVNDVINYIKAMNYAIERMKTLPLCNRLLLETHKVLLSGVRGEVEKKILENLGQVKIG